MAIESPYIMERGPELLRLRIWGQPCGAGSKTAEVVCRKGKIPVKDAHGNFVLRYRHATKGTYEWMKAVQEESEIAWKGNEPLDGPLWVFIECFEVRPKSHFRSGANAHLLKPDAPAFPSSTMTHDSGKMRRAIEDALTNAGVWADDKRVVSGGDCKMYADGEDPEAREARAVIRVGRMVQQTTEDLGLVSPPPVADQLALA